MKDYETKKNMKNTKKFFVMPMRHQSVEFWMLCIVDLFFWFKPHKNISCDVSFLLETLSWGLH